VLAELFISLRFSLFFAKNNEKNTAKNKLKNSASNKAKSMHFQVGFIANTAGQNQFAL
jgi:hypothetical protein